MERESDDKPAESRTAFGRSNYSTRRLGLRRSSRFADQRQHGHRLWNHETDRDAASLFGQRSWRRRRTTPLAEATTGAVAAELGTGDSATDTARLGSCTVLMRVNSTAAMWLRVCRQHACAGRRKTQRSAGAWRGRQGLQGRCGHGQPHQRFPGKSCRRNHGSVSHLSCSKEPLRGFSQLHRFFRRYTRAQKTLIPINNCAIVYINSPLTKSPRQVKFSGIPPQKKSTTTTEADQPPPPSLTPLATGYNACRVVCFDSGFAVGKAGHPVARFLFLAPAQASRFGQLDTPGCCPPNLTRLSRDNASKVSDENHASRSLVGDDGPGPTVHGGL